MITNNIYIYIYIYVHTYNNEHEQLHNDVMKRDVLERGSLRSFGDGMLALTLYWCYVVVFGYASSELLGYPFATCGHVRTYGLLYL